MSEAPMPAIALDCRLTSWPGIGRYCRELARALVDIAPAQPFVWLCHRSSREQCRDLPVGGAVRRLDLRSAPMSIGEQFEVPWLLWRNRIGLLHAPAAQTWPLLAPRVVATVHDLTLRHFPEFLPSRLGRFYYTLMVGSAVRRTRRLIAVSGFTGDDIVRCWPQAAGRVRVVLNGASGGFAPVADAAVRDRVRRELALPPNYLLFVGTWKRHKNLPTLLEAYARLDSAQRARYPLVAVAQADPRYPEVPEAVRRLGLERDVHWRSGVSDDAMPALYSMARALVLPSLYEGFGLPVAEAFACGTPAVLADASALPEVGADACLTFPPWDAAALAGALERIIEDDELHAALCARAVARARAFDWPAAAQQVLGIYREALA